MDIVNYYKMLRPPALDPIDFKVVIIGESKCGKTSFIRAFYNNHSPEEMYSDNGVRVYPCKFNFNNQQLRVGLFEIPSDPWIFPNIRKIQYLDASVYVFMYAFDNPSSVEMLNEKWIPEAVNIVNWYRRPVVVVGNKKDLKDDPHVLERLANEWEIPITEEELGTLHEKFYGHSYGIKCCSLDVKDVERVFHIIFYIANQT